ncbi:hypothetical protein [Streptomyces sp. IMTB 2501]|uniref:hypothetical protein n=1 Tax=Streptomyces sp. IMTB 2501 TaxID=1776340 RepID=UPI0015BF0061|nr:hypothetical protein [Streptomyces sp. IMTB 2501]
MTDTRPLRKLGHRETVAATLIQRPRHVDTADECWDENVQFNAAAREAVPRHIAEIRRLRRQPEAGLPSGDEEG